MGGYTITSLKEFHQQLSLHYGSLPFRFTTIDEVDGKTAKSGSSLLRIFQREGRFHKNLIVSKATLSNLSPEVKLLCILDDFMGTGMQFDSYMKSIAKFNVKAKLIYCPLAAHHDGLQTVEKKYPNVSIIPVEIINESYSFQDSKFMPKIAEKINIEEFSNFYQEFMQNKTKLKSDDFLGKEKQGLSYLFNLSTPNNNLPIFFYDDQNFSQLVPR